MLVGVGGGWQAPDIRGVVNALSVGTKNIPVTSA